MEKILLLFGKNEYLVLRKVREYIGTFGDNADIMKYDLLETEFSEVYEELITDSLFSSKKIIVINNVREFVKLESDDIVSLINYIKKPNENTLLIMTHIDAAMLEDDLFKEMNKYVYLEEIADFAETDFKEYVADALKNAGYKVEESAISILLERSVLDMYLLDQEIKKLMIYKIEDKKISKQDVLDIVSRNLEEHMYELVNNIIAKDKSRTLAIFDDLVTQKEDPIKIMNSIAMKMKEIAVIKEMLKNSATQDDIAANFGVSRNRAYHMKKNAESTSMDLVMRYIDDLTKLDYEIKSGFLDKKIGVELFLLKI